MKASPSILASACGLFCLLSACGGHRIETGGSVPAGDGISNVVTKPVEAPKAPTEPQFKKEGELEFLSEKGDTLSRIDLELASSDAEREQGLMFRTVIAEKTGMLFIFDSPEYQSFWMKNTPSSLDILFVSPDNRIINIYEFTSPYSTAGLPSKALSDKVVEVKGGYCAKYKIKAGCRIAYQLDKVAG